MRAKQVYVIAPNTKVTIAGGVLQVTPRGDARPHLAIDHFLKSLPTSSRSTRLACYCPVPVGLTLVQHLVQRHGRAIHVKSDGPGTGTEFTLRLPIAIEPP